MISTKSTQRGLNTYLNTFQSENGIVLNSISLSLKKGCAYRKEHGCHGEASGRGPRDRPFFHRFVDVYGAKKLCAPACPSLGPQY